MKPIVIFAEEKNGKVTLTKEELQEIVDQAYQDGREDANRYNWYTITPRWYGTTTDHTITTCSN